MHRFRILLLAATVTVAPAIFAQSTTYLSAPQAQAAYSSSLDGAILAGEGATSGGGQYQSGYRAPKPANSGWNHLTWEAGAGFDQPLAGASNTVNTAWRIQLGAGYNFVPRFGVLAEYGFNRFGLTDAAINAAGTDDGNVHLWSATLEPVFRWKTGGKFGGYVIGGGGFYRSLTSFTNPTVGTECSPFYGCYPVQENYVVSHFSSNQGGANLGLGFTFKTSDQGKLAFYTEARYEWVDTPGHYSEFVPVTVGLRW